MFALKALLAPLIFLCLAGKLGAADNVVSGVDENGVVHVRVWNLPTNPGTQANHVANWRVLKAFERENPTIKLHPATGISLPGLGIVMDVGPLMAISGGIAPDILYVNFRKSASYIDDEFLYPLDEYLEDYRRREGEKEFEFRIQKPLWPVIRRKGPVGNHREEHTWMMPEFPLVMTMSYRKDLFTKCGLDPNRPPRTWDELYEVCVKLTSNEKNTFGIFLGTGGAASWYFMNFLSSTGTKVVSEDANGVWHATFATPGAAQALRFHKKLIAGKRPDGSGRGFYTDKYQLIGEGRVGIQFVYLDGNDFAGLDTSGTQWGYAPVPMGPTGKFSAEINAKMWGIYRGQKDARVRAAAWKWLEFSGSRMARKIFADTLIEYNEVKSVHPAILENLGPDYQKYLVFMNQDLKDLYAIATEHATPEPYGKNCDLVYDYLDKPVQEAMGLEREGKFAGMSERQELDVLEGILKKSQDLAEVELIQNLPPEVQASRARVAFAVCVLIFSAFAFVFVRIYRVFTPEHERGRGWGFRKYRFAYLILVPAVGSIALWQYYPLMRGSLMAFQNYKIAVPVVEWVGLDNFAAVIYDRSFWTSILLSLYYTLLLVLLTWLPPVILAIMISELPKGTIFYRVVYYLPAVISGAVIIFLWKSFYDPSPMGLFNQLLAGIEDGVNRLRASVGMGPVDLSPQYWYEDKNLAMLCIVVPLGWATLGPGSLIYIAALKGIPDDLYEAADIDGASYFSKVIHIVIPKLRALLIISLVGHVIHGFNAADNVLVMTGGGPKDATLVTGLLIFKKAFVYTKYGVATAMAWIMSVMLIGFTIYQLKILSRLEFKSTGKA